MLNFIPVLGVFTTIGVWLVEVGLVSWISRSLGRISSFQ